MKALLAVLLSSVLLPASAPAQCYHAPYVPYAPTCIEKVIIKEVPIYVAAFVPVVSVGYAAPPATPYQPAPAATVNAGPPGVPVPAGAVARATAAPEGFSDAQVDALLLRLEARLQAKQAGTPPVEPASAPAPLPAGDVGKVFGTRCAACHTGATAKGSLTIFNKPGELAALDRGVKARIVLAAGDALMPPTAKGDSHHPTAVTDAELATIKAWARQ